MSTSSRHSRDLDLATLLQGLSLGLLLAWAASQLKLLLPPALLQPVWQLQAAEVLRGGAGLALLALLLQELAHRYDPDAEGLQQRLNGFRLLALAASIGFLLLIPLQISAGLREIRQATSTEATQVRRLQDTAQAIGAATTAEEMNRAIARLPGLPADFRGQFSRPIPEVRAALISQITPQIRQLQSRLQQIRGERIQAALKQFLFDGLTSLGYAVAFAAVARSGEEQPTLLQRWLWLPAELRARLVEKRGPNASGQPVSEQWISKIRESERTERSDRRRRK